MSESRTTLSGHDVNMLYDRSGLGAYHQRDSQVQVAYDRCILKFARYVEEMTIAKFKLDSSMIGAPPEGYTYEALVRALGVYSLMPSYSIISDASYVDNGEIWGPHTVMVRSLEVIKATHAILTSPTTVQRYELDDVDRKTVQRLRETLTKNGGVDNIGVSDTVASALELLINILDSGVAA